MNDDLEPGADVPPTPEAAAPAAPAAPAPRRRAGWWRWLLLPLRPWLHEGALGCLVLLGAGLALDTLSLPPGPLPFLVLVADLPLLALLFRGDGRRWKRWAWLYGMLHFGVALRWLGEIHPVQVLGAAVILGPVYVLLGLVIRWFDRRRFPLAFAVGLCVVFEEMLRTVWMGGMPWPARSLSFANDAALDPGMGWLLPAAAWTGAYGLSFLAGAAGGAVFDLLRRRADGPSGPRRLLALASPVAALALLAGLAAGHRAGLETGRSTPPLELGEMVVVQAVIPQDLKHGTSAEVKQMFDDHLSISGTAVRQLGRERIGAILWPVTMVPWPQMDADLAERFPEAWENAVGVAKRLRADVPEARGIPWLIGAIYHFRRGEERHASIWAYGDHDSLFWIDASKAPEMEDPIPPPPALGAQPAWRVARHDKTKLVPGGEYTPGGEIFPPLRWFRNLVSVIPELDPGARDQRPFALPARNAPDSDGGVGTVICFELAFPARCREWERAGARVLLNPGNYGWFGRTGFRSQIAALARLRAAELAVTVVMAGNTGPSAFYDPLGRPYGSFRALDALADEPAGGVGTTYRAGFAHAPVRAEAGGSTVYARFGDLGWYLLGLVSLLIALLRGRRTLSSGAEPGYTRSAAPAPDEGAG